jgi:hypothetical protein
MTSVVFDVLNAENAKIPTITDIPRNMRSIKNLSLTKLPDKSNYAVIGDQDGLRTPGRLQDYMAII